MRFWGDQRQRGSSEQSPAEARPTEILSSRRIRAPAQERIKQGAR